MADRPVFSKLTFSAPNGEPLTVDALNYALIYDNGDESYTVRINTEATTSPLQKWANENGLTPGTHLAVCMAVSAIEAAQYRDGTPLSLADRLDLMQHVISGIAVGVLRDTL